MNISEMARLIEELDDIEERLGEIAKEAEDLKRKFYNIEKVLNRSLEEGIQA